MRLFVRIYSLLVIFSLVAGCSPKGGSDSSQADPGLDQQKKANAGEPAQGRINGQTWVYQSGRAFFKKYQTNYIVVQLWSEEVLDPCKEKKGSTLQVRMNAPNEMTTWNVATDDPFNAAISVFFTDLNFKLQPLDNMRADLGEITLTSVDKRYVGGYLAASFQNPKVGGTSVAGDFVVPFCPNITSDGDNF